MESPLAISTQTSDAAKCSRSVKPSILPPSLFGAIFRLLHLGDVCANSLGDIGEPIGMQRRRELRLDLRRGDINCTEPAAKGLASATHSRHEADAMVCQRRVDLDKARTRTNLGVGVCARRHAPNTCSAITRRRPWPLSPHARPFTPSLPPHR